MLDDSVYEDFMVQGRRFLSMWRNQPKKWNQRGSPHWMLLRSKDYFRRVPVSYIVSSTIRHNIPALVRNIEMNNTLWRRLRERPR